MNMTPWLKVKRLHPAAIIPAHQKQGDAGADLVSIESLVIGAHDRMKVRTGLAFEIPPDYWMAVLPRSGLTSKGVLAVTGTIDPGYRGEVMVTMYNTTDHAYEVQMGDRIAQVVIHLRVEGIFEETKGELSASDRGTGGFGSTGR